MPLDLNQLHLSGQEYIVIQDLQMLKRDYLEEKTMNYTLEPSEALWVFTKYWNVALKSLGQRIFDKTNQFWSPTTTPTSTYCKDEGFSGTRH
jgi:hypothetical protein